jgi:hypothetical protein
LCYTRTQKPGADPPLRLEGGQRAEGTETWDIPWIVVLTANLGVSIYALGVYVLLGLGVTAAVLYGLYSLAVERLVLKR